MISGLFFIILFIIGSYPVPGAAADNTTGTGKFLVLCYHDIRDVVYEHYDPDENAVSTRHLIEHLAWLRGHDYHPVSIDDLVQAHQGVKKLPKNAVLLTFDDGLKSIYTRVYPVLKLFNYPAVVALVGSWLEGDQTLEIKYANRKLYADDFLTPQQIRELDGSGLIEFASHSYDLHRGVLGNPQGNMHPASRAREYFPTTNSYENDTAYEKRIRRDLEQSASVIERILGKKPRVIVWPYGKYNRTSIRIAESLGMTIHLTLEPKVNQVKNLPVAGRNLIMHNPTLDDLLWLLRHPYEDSDPRRVVQVNIDDLYDDNRDKMLKNFDLLVERVFRLDINTVYLQAFSDSNNDGTADALYFPNRHLPMRADLFNRAAWQLKIRCGVEVFAWLPVSAFNIPEYQKEKLSFVIEASSDKPRPSQYRRLSLFDPRVRKVIFEIYEDLGKYADFDGLLFYDDAFLSDNEDASPAALRHYQEKWRLPADVGAIQDNPAAYRTWKEKKTAFLIDFTHQLKRRTEQYCAPLKTARNLQAEIVLQPDNQNQRAQSYPLFLENYHITVITIPDSKHQSQSDQWLEKLVSKAKNIEPTLKKTLFLLPGKNRHTKTPVSALKLVKQMEIMILNGALNYGYYPDDFVRGNPRLEEIRKGISLRTYPYWKK